jgi:hypothetical protein
MIGAAPYRTPARPRRILEEFIIATLPFPEKVLAGALD